MLGFRMRYSGELRYLEKFSSQALAVRGGSEPVTGFHSVIESLHLLVRSWFEYQMERAPYPDSVNLVNPPRITIPNTSPADPMSQYPTPLLLISGKSGFAFFSAASLIACCPRAMPSARPPSGDSGAFVPAAVMVGAFDVNEKGRRSDAEADGDLLGNGTKANRRTCGFERHLRQINSAEGVNRRPARADIGSRLFRWV